MAEVKGKLCSCDRCGVEVFLKATGESETDGGYTRWNKFESYPDGWTVVEIPVPISSTNRAHDYLMACPNCNALWRNVLNDHFLKGTRHYIGAVEVDDG